MYKKFYGKKKLKFIKIKNHRRFKKKKIKKKYNPIIFKFFFLLIIIIFSCLTHFITNQNILDFSEDKNEIKEVEYDWIKNAKDMIDKQLALAKGEYIPELQKHISEAQSYFSFKKYNDSEDENSPNNLEIKRQLIQAYSGRCRKDFSLIKNVFIFSPDCFGNRIAAYNNLIYLCEIIGIKNIYLNSNSKFFIKNDIITDKIRISLIPESKIDCNSQDTYCGNLYGNYFFFMVIRAKRRSLIFKEEFKRFLPKIKINKKDLILYIRSDDSFAPNGCIYTPCPFCFYEKIITKFEFKDIYIIAKNDKNPVIGKLLSKYPKIKHQLNTIEYDLAMLCNTYNLANSVSSFTLAAIAFNDNLKNLFEYEIYKIHAALIHYHFDIDKLNKKFNVYRMKPSENYFKKMYDWKNTDEQRQLIFDEKCIYDFNKTQN